MSLDMRVCSCGKTFTSKRKEQRYCSHPCSREARKADAATRFWTKVQKTETCWLWTGGRSTTGYGHLYLRTVNGRNVTVKAHRFAYELLVGPIPEGLELDHVRARGCRHRHCVRPDHLEIVTPHENTLRGDSPAARHARQTACVRGHPFTEENTWLSASGRRGCRTCNRERQAQHRAAMTAEQRERKVRLGREGRHARAAARCAATRQQQEECA